MAMLEKCCSSMEHYEHMCSYTLNGCAIERAYEGGKRVCLPCDDKSHNHQHICTPSLIAT
jgi:hypothetical protein